MSSILNHKWETVGNKIRVADNSEYHHLHIATVSLMNPEHRQIAAMVAAAPEAVECLYDIAKRFSNVFPLTDDDRQALKKAESIILKSRGE